MCNALSAERWSLRNRVPTLLGFVALSLGVLSGPAYTEPIVPGYEFINSHYEISVTPVGGTTETIVMETIFPSKIRRGPQIGATMNVEVLRAEAHGTSPTLGPLILRAGSEFGIEPTKGRTTNIIQNATAPGHAVGSPKSLVSGQLYFDVYYEITLVNMGVIITNAPIPEFGVQGHPERTATTIPSIPPTSGTLFIGEATPYELRVKTTGVTMATAGSCSNLVLDESELSANAASRNLFKLAMAKKERGRATAVASADQPKKD